MWSLKLYRPRYLYVTYIQLYIYQVLVTLYQPWIWGRNCLYGKPPASRMTHCDNFPQKRMYESEENNTLYICGRFWEACKTLYILVIFFKLDRKSERNSHMRFLPKKRRGNAIAEKKRGGEGRHNTSKREREGLTLHESGGGGRGRGIVSRVVVGAGYGRKAGPRSVTRPSSSLILRANSGLVWGPFR